MRKTKVYYNAVNAPVVSTSAIPLTTGAVELPNDKDQLVLTANASVALTNLKTFVGTMNLKPASIAASSPITYPLTGIAFTIQFVGSGWLSKNNPIKYPLSEAGILTIALPGAAADIDELVILFNKEAQNVIAITSGEYSKQPIANFIKARNNGGVFTVETIAKGETVGFTITDATELGFTSPATVYGSTYNWTQYGTTVGTVTPPYILTIGTNGPDAGEVALKDFVKVTASTALYTTGNGPEIDLVVYSKEIPTSKKVKSFELVDNVILPVSVDPVYSSVIEVGEYNSRFDVLVNTATIPVDATVEVEFCYGVIQEQVFPAGGVTSGYSVNRSKVLVPANWFSAGTPAAITGAFQTVTVTDKIGKFMRLKFLNNDTGVTPGISARVEIQ